MVLQIKLLIIYRIQHVDCNSVNDDMEYDINRYVSTVFSGSLISVISMQELANNIKNDEVLSVGENYIINGWLKKQNMEESIKPFYFVHDELSVHGSGCLARECRATIPLSLCARVMCLVREGHHGIEKIKSRCRSSVWWPAIDRDLELHVKNCTACVILGKSVKPIIPPMEVIKCENKPWFKIAIDILGEIEAAIMHERFIIVCVDSYSHFPEVKFCGDVTSKTVIEFLKSLLFCTLWFSE